MQTKHDLEELVDAINAGRPQCPVGLNTLVIPRKAASESAQQQPYVYLKCGHVQGHHDWGQEKDKSTRRCPMCMLIGPIVKLCMGIEPAFYVDSGPPTYAFSPCGHMATEKTVKCVFVIKFLDSSIFCLWRNTKEFFLRIWCVVSHLIMSNKIKKERQGGRKNSFAKFPDFPNFYYPRPLIFNQKWLISKTTND